MFWLLIYPPLFMMAAVSEKNKEERQIFLISAKGFTMRCRRSRLALAPLLVLFGHLLIGCEASKAPSAGPTPLGNEYLFCFWNVENFFDDKLDHRTGPGDKEYDSWFAGNPQILKLKLEKLTEALLRLNGGKGPDILAIAEVESVRAANLLQQALNAKIAEPSLLYHSVLMKEVTQGRHIAPAILTRLPVIHDKTRSHGSRMRIIEGHILVEGHELIVMASHWTSRLREGSEKGRKDYADKLYGAANAIYHSNPSADILICGDFNDTPADVSVTEHLHATGNVQAVKAGGQHLRLLDLMADKDPNKGYGSHYYHRWLIFDHIVVSPGLLDQVGWTCEPTSVATVSSLARPGDSHHRPWRFGGEKDHGDRGYSDHFPVTLKLKVQH
jgi:endonuclease/exonuclease/phosphatase family metal-dependent hydrolase